MWHIRVTTIDREIITKWFSVHLPLVDSGRSGIRIREWDRNRVEELNMKIDMVLGIKVEKKIKVEIEVEMEMQTDANLRVETEIKEGMKMEV